MISSKQCAAAGAAVLAACALGYATTALAAGAPVTGPQPNAQMQHVLADYFSLGAEPVYEVSVARARLQPTPGDAVKLVYEQNTGLIWKPLPVASVTDINIKGAAGPLPARVYNPKKTTGPAPVILYFHGGGWVIGDLNTYDASDRILADGTGAIVLSVAYREGPEVRFPGAHDDAFASYRWLLANAASIGGDATRIAVAGESAGGNLAIDTAIAARDAKLPAPVAELLIYPVAGTNTHTASYEQTLTAQPLNRAAVLWYVNHYISSPKNLADPRLNVVGASNDLHNLPPTTIINAEVDPLRTEGVTLRDKLRAAGVSVEQKTYPGVTHEFFGTGLVVDQAKLAESFAIGRLNQAFGAGK